MRFSINTRNENKLHVDKQKYVTFIQELKNM
jgi:hypothetical protein